VAGNSGLCASGVLEGLSCLHYSEKEREIGLALRQAALEGSEFVCQVTATGRPTAALLAALATDGSHFHTRLYSTHFSLCLSDLTAQSVHREHINRVRKRTQR
jgi:hypothetical protein